jgi:uncharacterized protein YdaU (DUF1376 family)
MSKSKGQPRQNQDVTHKRSPYFKFYADDWIGGTLNLTLEQRGLYIATLAAMWSRQGAIPLDQMQMATSCDKRQVNRILPQLIDLGKLHLDADNRVYNTRLMDRIEGGSREAHSGTAVQELTNSSGTVVQELTDIFPEKRVKSKEGAQTEIHPHPLPLPDKKKNPNGFSSTAAPSDLTALEAFQAWNAMALRCGLAQAAKLTPDRKRKLLARLRDHGPESWAKALANVERSKFLRGESGDREWRANLDFLLQPASFTKVLEGTYGNGAHAEPVDIDATRAGLAEVDRLMADLDRQLRM